MARTSESKNASCCPFFLHSQQLIYPPETSYVYHIALSIIYTFDTQTTLSIHVLCKRSTATAASATGPYSQTTSPKPVSRSLSIDRGERPQSKRLAALRYVLIKSTRYARPLHLHTKSVAHSITPKRADRLSEEIDEPGDRVRVEWTAPCDESSRIWRRIGIDIGCSFLDGSSIVPIHRLTSPFITRSPLEQQQTCPAPQRQQRIPTTSPTWPFSNVISTT